MDKESEFNTTEYPTRKLFPVLAVIAFVTTIWIYFTNVSNAVVVDGILMSVFVVTVTATIVSTITWILLSWAHTGNNHHNVKPMTVIDIMFGALAGYVMISFVAGWVGPMAAILLGIFASVSLYAIMSIRNKKFPRDTNLSQFVIRSIIWFFVVGITVNELFVYMMSLNSALNSFM